MNKKKLHTGYGKPEGEVYGGEEGFGNTFDRTAENEKEGGFGGDPDENFFRGEILYEDPDIVPEHKSAGDAKKKTCDTSFLIEDDESEDESDLLDDPDESPVYRSEERRRMKEQSAKKTPRKKKRKSFLGRLLRPIIVLLAVLLLGLYLAVSLAYGKLNYAVVDSVKGASYKDDGVINVLLIGNDSRENGEDGRSDAMILLSISNKTKTIQMTSLLRDIYVEIPGHDGNRLNAAYAFGGPELLMETIELNFGISVNRYVLVNFEAFANLVDAVGGVDLELTNDEVQYVNGYLVEYNMLTGKPEGTDYLDASLSGMIHLNGPQALAYSRNRYIGTDFGRTERQRKVLSAVIQNMPKAVLKNPMKLVDGLLPNLTTNLTRGECYLLSLQAGKLLAYDMVQSSVPVEGSYQNATIRGMAVLQVDFEKNREYLKSSIYGK